MDIKYTLEILTKDIQDIEKLVGNLAISPGGSTLELDLALSKLRNVYDVLTVIRADLALETRSARRIPSPPGEPEAPSAVSNAGRNPSILADTFIAESSINDNLAGNLESELDSRLLGQPIDSISRNIGINDRFLIIRELFNGDPEGFKRLIDELDRAGDLQSAKNLLEKQFEGSPGHDGVSILSSLVKRKFTKP
jgi:hypothetical protein